MTGHYYAINVHQVLFKYRTSLYPTCHCFLASSRYDMAWYNCCTGTHSYSWGHRVSIMGSPTPDSDQCVFCRHTLLFSFLGLYVIICSDEKQIPPPLLYVSICLYCENLITFLIKKTVFALIDEPLTLCKHVYTIIGVMSFLCLVKK